MHRRYTLFRRGVLVCRPICHARLQRLLFDQIAIFRVVFRNHDPVILESKINGHHIEGDMSGDAMLPTQ